MTLQLQTFDEDNDGRIYSKVICEAVQGGKKISPKDIFSAITCQSDIIVETTNYESKLLISDIPTLLENKNSASITLRLPLQRDLHRLDNFMLVSMLDDHLQGLSVRTLKVEEALRIADWEDPEPILHQTSKYCFKAAYSPKNYTI